MNELYGAFLTEFQKKKTKVHSGQSEQRYTIQHANEKIERKLNAFHQHEA